MTTVKPMYSRKPLISEDPLNNQNINNSSYCGLSSMKDSLEFREDLFNKQMARQNQTKWSFV
jgi:hypothetical protein